MGDEGFCIGVCEELGDFGGEGKGGGFGSSSDELGVAEGAKWFVVSADDVLDGVGRAVILFTELEAALGSFLVVAVSTDDFEFSGDVEFALVSGFDTGLGGLALSKNWT